MKAQETWGRRKGGARLLKGKTKTKLAQEMIKKRCQSSSQNERKRASLQRRKMPKISPKLGKIEQSNPGEKDHDVGVEKSSEVIETWDFTYTIVRAAARRKRVVRILEEREIPFQRKKKRNRLRSPCGGGSDQ